jgi:hypothetical protein
MTTKPKRYIIILFFMLSFIKSWGNPIRAIVTFIVFKSKVKKLQIAIYSFGLLIGVFCFLLPQKFWEWFYLGIRPYKKGILH